MNQSPAPVTPQAAYSNLEQVVENFQGNAKEHRLLAQSLAVIRDRLTVAGQLEEDVQEGRLVKPDTKSDDAPEADKRNGAAGGEEDGGEEEAAPAK